MPITLAGSARRRVVDGDAGAVAVAGSAPGSIVRARVVARGAAVAGSAQGSTVRARAVERDAEGAAVAGSAQGSTAVAGCRGGAAAVEGVAAGPGRGVVATGVDSTVGAVADGTDRVGASCWAAAFPGAGAVGDVRLTAAPRAAGLFASKGGGSVDFLTWSADGVASAGPTAFSGGEIGSLLCARTGVTPTATRITPAPIPARRPPN